MNAGNAAPREFDRAAGPTCGVRSLADAAGWCRHAVGNRWFVDETHVKACGQWRYVYRAVDQFGQVIDVYVAKRRDAGAARRLFTGPLATTRITPVEVVTAVPAGAGNPVRQAPERRIRRVICRVTTTPIAAAASPAISAGSRLGL